MSAWPSALASKLNDLYPDQSKPTTPSFSTSTDSITVALANIQSWAASILHQASELVHPTPQPISLNDKVLDLLTTYSTASFTSLAVLILSLIFLAYRYLMSDRNSFGWSGGRSSPYLATGGWADPSRNLSGHFEYIDPDDDLYTKHRPSAASTIHRDYEAIDDSDPNTPDRVHVSYRLNQMSIDFPAYSINEGRATVKDLRRKVADRIGVDPRRIRLLYKKKELKRNHYALKEYRMKQNSEATAVFTEDYGNYDGQDRDSPNGSGSDSGSGSNRAKAQPPQRPRSHSSVRYRSDENIPKVQTNGNGFLSPGGHVSSTPVERRHRESLRPSDGTAHRDSIRASSRGPEYRDSGRQPERNEPRRDRDRDPSRNRGHSPAPPPVVPSADPKTPLGKLQALSSTFHTVWLPQCTKFILSPPSDPDVKKKEHLKLSESVMQYIVDKADAIEIDGDSEARNMRKALINEVSSVVKRLDGAVK